MSANIEVEEKRPYNFFFPYSVHLTLWLFYELFLYYFNVGRGSIPSDIYFSIRAFSILTTPLLFYTYFLYLVPKFLEKNRVLVFFCISLALVLLTSFLIIEYVELAKTWFENLPLVLQRKVNYLSKYLWVNFNLTIFIALATGARFANDWYKNQDIEKELEHQNKLSEIALLRSQINPHFLFNTLNSIYSLTYKKDDNAAKAVLKLSELMRYMLQEAHTTEVLLEQEIHYIQNYIDLQKLRLNVENTVVFNIKGDTSGKRISPMLLIPFIENAFKHGTSPQKDSKLYFELEIKNNKLRFRSENKVVNSQRANQSGEEKGIGQENVLKRLALLYPERHKIAIKTLGGRYVVSLDIEL